MFRNELDSLINKHSMEGGSNTPDFILGEFLAACLSAFDHAVGMRDQWYSIAPMPGWTAPRAGSSAPAAAPNSDYAKCADDILKLDLADEVINKHGCLVAILKRHFA